MGDSLLDLPLVASVDRHVPLFIFAGVGSGFGSNVQT